MGFKMELTYSEFEYILDMKYQLLDKLYCLVYMESVNLTWH